MEVHCKPSNVRHVTRIAAAPAQHNIPSMAQRTTQATPTRYWFSFNELYHVLYLQREVEVVKVENIKPQIVAANSPEKKAPVPKNKDSLVKCEMCRGQPQGECTEHGPLFFPRKTKPSSLEDIRLSYAISSFPDEVQLCWSSIPVAGYGVSAKQHIPIGTWIGPYEGRRMRPEDVTAEMDTSYMWEIFQDGKLVCYLDASDENTSSWMRFIRCARHRDEQNLYAFQYCGNIYYRAFRNISVGQELLVWYDEKYQHHMGLPLNIQDMAVVDPNGNNLLYDLMACNIKPPISEQPREPVTQSTPVTKQSHGKVLAHASAALLFHQQEPPCPAQQSPAMAQQVTEVAPRRALPVTTVTEHSAAHTSHPVFVSVTPKYPIPAPINTSVSGTVTQRTPILVTQSPSITIATRPASAANKVQSLERKKLLHDRHVSPLMEMKHLQAIHGTHARQRIMMNGDTAVLPHGQDIAFSDLQRSANAIKEVNGLVEDQLELSENSESTMWKCGQCQRSFTQRALLQIHVCPGMANRPYKCGHCADSFSQSNELRTHVVKHTNEKPFKCGYCSRSFAGSTTLNNHIRTHTGEKPFICRKCRKTFSTASQLSRHQRIPSECI